MSKKEVKRWRAEKGCVYYRMIAGFRAERSIDDRMTINNFDFENRNYFQNLDDAKEVCEISGDECLKVLLRQAGELNDFTWAVSEMKKGNKVRRKDWCFWCFLKIKPIYIGQITIDVFTNNGEKYNLFLYDIEATDWEIYEEESGSHKKSLC